MEELLNRIRCRVNANSTDIFLIEKSSINQDIVPHRWNGRRITHWNRILSDSAAQPSGAACITDGVEGSETVLTGTNCELPFVSRLATQLIDTVSVAMSADRSDKRLRKIGRK